MFFALILKTNLSCQRDQTLGSRGRLNHRIKLGLRRAQGDHSLLAAVRLQNMLSEANGAPRRGLGRFQTASPVRIQEYSEVLGHFLVAIQERAPRELNQISAQPP